MPGAYVGAAVAVGEAVGAGEADDELALADADDVGALLEPGTGSACATPTAPEAKAVITPVIATAESAERKCVFMILQLFW
jgi:hypothetical protein